MYHSVNFVINNVTYNTWDNWRLIPASRPSVAMPKVRTKYVEIPGMNGQMDISEILSGQPLYENRSGSWEFYLSRRPFSNGTRHQWFSDWRIVSDALHGKKGKFWLEDDPYYIYEGRFALNEKFNTQKDYSKITIEYTVAPWPADRITKADNTGGWLWDPFDFVLDEIDMNTDPHKLVERTHL